MKKIVGITCCLFTLLLSSMAYGAKAESNNGFYVQANGALAFFADIGIESNSGDGDVVTDTGKTFSGAVGYQIESNRVEAEIAYSKTEADQLDTAAGSFDATGDLSLITCLVNFYYDFDTGTSVAPYLGAGIGFSKVDADNYTLAFTPPVTISDDDIVFAWQLMTGVSLPIAEKVSVDGSLRLFSTADPNFQDIKASIFAYSLGVGLRYNF